MVSAHPPQYPVGSKPGTLGCGTDVGGSALVAGKTLAEPTGNTLLIPASALAPTLDPTQAQAAPSEWERPRLWTPGGLICVAVGRITFDDPGAGRVTLDVSFWRDPLDPSGRYSAMVETW